MATKLELEISLDSKGAVAGVKSLDKELGGLNKTTQTATTSGKGLMGSLFGQVTAANLASQAVNKLTAFVQESAQAYMEAEKQQARMNVVLRRSGEDVDKANESISAFADKMEYLTGVDDDQVKTLEILARQYNIQKDRIDEAVKSSIALTEIGGDLEGNLKAVANAYNGNWMQLGRLIPEIRTANTESERMEILQRAVASGFEMSTAAMNTNAGKLQELKNFWDDLKKATGGVLVTALQGIDAMSGMHSKMAEYSREQITQLEAFDQAISNFEARVGTKFKSYGAPSLGVQGVNDIESDLSTGYLADTKAALDFQAALDKLEESKKKHVEVEKTLAQVLADRWAEANKNYEQDKAYSDFINSKFTTAIVSASDAWADDAPVILERISNLDELTKAGEQYADNLIKKSIPATKKWSVDWDDANSVLGASKQMLSVVKQGLSDIGIELSPQAEAFMGAAEGATMFVDGLTTGNPLTMIAGGIKLITSAIKAFAGDGIGEAIDRENKWMKLNDQLEKQLRDMAKDLGSVHEATSVMLDDIISQSEVSVKNFDQYAQRIQQILSDFDRGEMSLTETTNEMGDAFQALIDKAGDLGTEGSAAMMALFDDLQNRGIQVKEITQYINQQWQAGLDGYKKYLKGEFSTATIEVFGQLLAYENKVAANQTLVDGVKGITQALTAMSNATRLNETEFDSFELAARDAFDALQAKGFTERESLTQLAPMLARMVFLNKEYGLAIDAETQALIDKAKADGVNLDNYKSQEEIFSDMSTSLKDLVDIFKNAFPAAIKNTSDAFKDLNKNAGNFDPDTNYNPNPYKGKQPDIMAADGFYSPRLSRDMVIQAHTGERVEITPRQDVGNGGGSRTTHINITLAGTINQEVVADAIMKAWRANTRGMRSLMES